ncbi:MAG: manganese efflux pump [Candidatus Gottesmanbacteria bacterium]
MITSILIALGLNFDTFSVSIVEGANSKKITIKDALIVGLLFGFSQAFMALIGSFFGLGFKSLIINIDHWIAFLLLILVGVKLIFESKTKEDKRKKSGVLDFQLLLLLAVATSIDSLIIGITLAFIKNTIVTTVLLIGIITFIVSFIGYYCGKQLKKICKNNTKIIGGLILIFIGLKILIEHLYFGG